MIKPESLSDTDAAILAVQHGVEPLAAKIRAESALARRTRGRRHAYCNGHVIVGDGGQVALLSYFAGYPKGNNGWTAARVRFGPGEETAARAKLVELVASFAALNAAMGGRLVGLVDLPRPGAN